MKSGEAMLQTPLSGIQKSFSTVEDPRVNCLVEHNLLEMIIMSICAVICSADNWVEAADWGRGKMDWLKQHLELKTGIPSHDTVSGTKRFAFLVSSCVASGTASYKWGRSRQAARTAAGPSHPDHPNIGPAIYVFLHSLELPLLFLIKWSKCCRFPSCPTTTLVTWCWEAYGDSRSHHFFA